MLPDFDSAQDLQQLYAMLDAIQVKNGWNKPTPSLYPHPKQKFVPAHWDYGAARAALHAAGRLVGTEWAERRNLILANPIPGNDYPTVTTLVAAYQMVKGGESACSHRHTPNAMRIVMEAGAETYTVVDGKNIPMQAGDVLLTPNWAYHGHDNRSAEESYWIDILDAPLVHLLGPMFFERHPDNIETADTIDPENPMRFAFCDYHRELMGAAECAPGVKTLVLGPPTLATFDRTAISLRAGSRWDIPRHTANEIYVVVAGQGKSTIGAHQYSWGKGDVMAAPSWMDQHHEAADDAVLIRMSDAPLMQAVGWLRSE